MSTKLYENLLNKFKKANKSRRLVIAGEAGFESPEEYEQYLNNQLKEQTPNVAEIEKEELTDIVIAFDTTGSMSSYIGNVKEHVTTLIPELFKQNPNLKVSIVAFGDYCDMNNYKTNDFGNAYQLINLTNSENELINFVRGAKNTGGGDGDEFYELVIKKVTEETNWREGSNRSMLLIGDASPHDSHYIYRSKQYNIDWKQEALKAKEKGIKIDTLSINLDTLSIQGRSFYEKVASMTGGVCLPFNNSKKMSQVTESYALARGGKNTKAAFMDKMTTDEVSGDKELKDVYDAYSKEIL